MWSSPSGTRDVAIKSLKDSATEEEKVKFLQEAAINGQFHHRNVVKLYGVVTVGEPVSEDCNGNTFVCYDNNITYADYDCSRTCVTWRFERISTKNETSVSGSTINLPLCVCKS